MPELLRSALLCGHLSGKIGNCIRRIGGGDQSARHAKTHCRCLPSNEREIGLLPRSTIDKQQLVATHALDDSTPARIDAEAPGRETAADLGRRYRADRNAAGVALALHGHRLGAVVTVERDMV